MSILKFRVGTQWRDICVLDLRLHKDGFWHRVKAGDKVFANGQFRDIICQRPYKWIIDPTGSQCETITSIVDVPFTLKAPQYQDEYHRIDIGIMPGTVPTFKKNIITGHYIFDLTWIATDSVGVGPGVYQEAFSPTTNPTSNYRTTPIGQITDPALYPAAEITLPGVGYGNRQLSGRIDVQGRIWISSAERKAITYWNPANPIFKMRVYNLTNEADFTGPNLVVNTGYSINTKLKKVTDDQYEYPLDDNNELTSVSLLPQSVITINSTDPQYRTLNPICIEGSNDFGNKIKTKTFYSENCPDGQFPAPYVYMVPANRYYGSTQQLADDKAQADIDTNGQAAANANGACTDEEIFYSAEISEPVTRTDCAVGLESTTVTFTVDEGQFTSLISQEDADEQAQEYFDDNKVQYAIDHALCLPKVYKNTIQQKVFTKQCTIPGQTGTTVTYIIPANIYSAYTQLEADNMAIAALNAGGQGYANTHGTCVSVLFWNVLKSQAFSKTNCGAGFTGSTFTYVVPAFTHSGGTQAEADHKADQDILDYGQAWVNTRPGGCTQTTFWNVERSASFTKNDCVSGTGQTRTYTVAAHTYSSGTQAGANAAADADIAANGQTWVNDNGDCLVAVAWNTEQSMAFFKEGCGEDQAPSTTTVTVPAHTYSAETIGAANAIAVAWILAHGQDIANADGFCVQVVFWNAELSETFYNEDCPDGQVAQPYVYTVPAHTYSGPTQEDADAEAQADIDDNGQDAANTFGNCTDGSFGNNEKNDYFANTNCVSPKFPTTFRIFVPANTYYADTQEEADDIAEAWLAANGPALATADPRAQCNDIAGVVPCGELYYLLGTGIYDIAIGNSIGSYISLNYDMFVVPDRMIGSINGVQVFDTGYRGDADRQAELDAALIIAGLPPATIAGPSVGSLTFVKPSAHDVLHIEVLMPISGSNMQFTIGCPVPPVGNEIQSETFYSQECEEGQAPLPYVYTVPADTYYRQTLSEANAAALADIAANGQAQANLHGTCESITPVGNTVQSQTFLSESCADDYVPVEYTYTVAADTYFAPTVLEANELALQEIAENGQDFANSEGECTPPPITYYNDEVTIYATKECTLPSIGSNEPYTIPAGAYSSIISKVDANNQAIAAANAGKQANANSVGSCSVPTGYYVVNACENWNACLVSKAAACAGSLPHTPGTSCLYSVRADGIALVGDTLFIDDVELGPGYYITFGCAESLPYLAYNELGGDKIWVKLDENGVILEKGLCSDTPPTFYEVTRAYNPSATSSAVACSPALVPSNKIFTVNSDGILDISDIAYAYDAGTATYKPLIFGANTWVSYMEAGVRVWLQINGSTGAVMDKGNCGGGGISYYLVTNEYGYSCQSNIAPHTPMYTTNATGILAVGDTVYKYNPNTLAYELFKIGMDGSQLNSILYLQGATKVVITINSSDSKVSGKANYSKITNTILPTMMNDSGNGKLVIGCSCAVASDIEVRLQLHGINGISGSPNPIITTTIPKGARLVNLGTISTDANHNAWGTVVYVKTVPGGIDNDDFFNYTFSVACFGPGSRTGTC